MHRAKKYRIKNKLWGMVWGGRGVDKITCYSLESFLILFMFYMVGCLFLWHNRTKNKKGLIDKRSWVDCEHDFGMTNVFFHLCDTNGTGTSKVNKITYLITKIMQYFAFLDSELSQISSFVIKRGL